MTTFLKNQVTKQLAGISEEILKDYANHEGAIFTIVTEVGTLVSTRKTYGSASRAIQNRYLLREQETSVPLHVVKVSIKELIQTPAC